MTTLAPILANRPRLPPSVMDDEQRRAMFAHMHGGGGGGSHGVSGSWTPGGTRDRLRSAADVSELEKKLKDYGIWGSVMGPDLPIPPRLAAALSKLKALPTAIGSAITSAIIGEYRDKNPTIDPRLDHYLAMGQQIAAYVAAISGLSATKQALGAGLEKIPLGESNVAEAASAALTRFGKSLANLGEVISSKLPEPLRKAAGKLYDAYTITADYTGASITDVGAATGAPKKLAAAREMRSRAAEMRAQADAIESGASDLFMDEKTKAGKILAKSHDGSMVDWQSAQRMYREGADKYFTAEKGANVSKLTAKDMREQAAQMEAKAADLEKQAKTSLKKAALVAGGAVAKQAHDELKIEDYQKQMEDAWARGDSFSIPAETPRSPLETALAAAIGTLGNPIEKQTRYGLDKYLASVAAYRASYDAIGKAEKTGELTRDEAQVAREKLAQHKPLNMAGKTPWTFAPASAAFLAWQGGKVADTLKRTEIDRRTPGSYIDGDTIIFDKTPSVRLLDINAPEVPHQGHNDPKHPERTTGEPMGLEAAVYAAKLVADGQYVRIVSDSHPKASGTDVYGRTLASVETLPKPLDQLLRVPVVGKLIPAQEFQSAMIQAGLADTAYRQLSGPTDVGAVHDKVRAAAQAAQKGIWSSKVKAQLPWVGKEKTVAELRRNAAPMSSSQTSNLLGAGLMTTGQSGIFKPMGSTGTVLAQVWNAALAVLGARDYNKQAAQNQLPTMFRRPKAVKTDYETMAEQALAARRRKN